MKVKVDQDACIGCGMCIDICPEIFKYNEENKSESVSEEIPTELQDKVTESADVCPVDAVITE